MEAHWVPVFFIYCLRSKYKTWSRKGKPHDFNIGVEVKIKTVLPYELVCANHRYVRREIEQYSVAKPITIHHKATRIVLEGGEEIVLKEPINYSRFKRYVTYQYSIGRKIFYLMKEKGLTEKYGLKYVKSSSLWLASNILKLLGYEKSYYGPKIIKQIEEIVIEEKTVETEYIEREVEKIVAYETADEFIDELSREMLGAIGEVVVRWFGEPISKGGYEFVVPVDESIVSEYDEGLSVNPVCILTTTGYISSPIEDVDLISSRAEVIFSMFERSNNFYEEPQVNFSWSEILDDYVESNLDEILDRLKEFYIRHVLGAIE